MVNYGVIHLLLNDADGLAVKLLPIFGRHGLWLRNITFYRCVEIFIATFGFQIQFWSFKLIIQMPLMGVRISTQELDGSGTLIPLVGKEPIKIVKYNLSLYVEMK